MPAKQHQALSINPAGVDLTHVATYNRAVKASLERVWENVRDWEHLPHLHDSSFDYCELDEAGDWGWRVWSNPDHTSWFELVIDSDRYVVRTMVDGEQASEIWTYLCDQGDETDVRVEFHAAGVTPDNKDEVGQLYIAVYDTLWTEDEEMMRERQRRLDQKRRRDKRVVLGMRSELESQLPLRFELGGREYALTCTDDQWHATPTICPHMLGPLAPGDRSGTVTCPWHGYTFDLGTGTCLSPSTAQCRLGAIPTVTEEDGQLVASTA